MFYSFIAVNSKMSRLKKRNDKSIYIHFSHKKLNFITYLLKKKKKINFFRP